MHLITLLLQLAAALLLLACIGGLLWFLYWLVTQPPVTR